MEDKFKSVCEAICYWLGYQYSIGRERLIHEASLRYPIADAITSNGTSIDKIQLEKGHPCFEDKVVDIFVCNKNVKSIEIDSIESIFELKLSKQDTGNVSGKERQRIVDDILRLAYFNLKYQKDAFFLICGTYKDFKNYFVGDKATQMRDANQNIQVGMRQGKDSKNNQTIVASDKWNIENSLYKDYFYFDYIDTILSGQSPKKKVYTFEILDKDPSTNEFGLKSFQKSYKSKKNKLDQEIVIFKEKLKIKTTCVAITPFESKPNRTHACGIWRIEGINEG